MPLSQEQKHAITVLNTRLEQAINTYRRTPDTFDSCVALLAQWRSLIQQGGALFILLLREMNIHISSLPGRWSFFDYLKLITQIKNDLTELNDALIGSNVKNLIKEVCSGHLVCNMFFKQSMKTVPGTRMFDSKQEVQDFVIKFCDGEEIVFHSLENLDKPREQFNAKIDTLKNDDFVFVSAYY